MYCRATRKKYGKIVRCLAWVAWFSRKVRNVWVTIQETLIINQRIIILVRLKTLICLNGAWKITCSSIQGSNYWVTGSPRTTVWIDVFNMEFPHNSKEVRWNRAASININAAKLHCTVYYISPNTAWSRRSCTERILIAQCSVKSFQKMSVLKRLFKYRLTWTLVRHHRIQIGTVENLLPEIVTRSNPATSIVSCRSDNHHMVEQTLSQI